MAETNPTPKPATRRPMTMVARAEAANICEKSEREGQYQEGHSAEFGATRRTWMMTPAM